MIVRKVDADDDDDDDDEALASSPPARHTTADAGMDQRALKASHSIKTQCSVHSTTETD